MKIILLATSLTILCNSSSWCQTDRPQANVKAEELIRETKNKVLQRELEATLIEKLELEKQILTAPAEQQESLKAKVAALAKFCEGLERDLMQPPPWPKPSPAALKKSAQEQMAKLQRWRSEKDATLRQAISNLRQTAVGGLKQLAGNSEPAASTALLSEARRLGILEPETPLESPAPSPATLELKGIWEHGLSPFRRGCWSPSGLGLQPDGTPHGTWTWLDESQGLFVVDDTGSKWVNLCRVVDKDNVSSVVIDGAQFSYKRKAPESPVFPPLPPSCDIITKLIGAEKTLRDQAAQAWKQETEKASKVVESVMLDLPEPERSDMSSALSLAQKQPMLQSRTEPDARLSGKWITEGRTLEFISDGVVLVKGEPKGTWRWGKARSHSCIVFTLGAGQLTALGELGADSMEVRIIGAETKHAMKQ